MKCYYCYSKLSNNNRATNINNGRLSNGDIYSREAINGKLCKKCRNDLVDPKLKIYNNIIKSSNPSILIIEDENWEFKLTNNYIGLFENSHHLSNLYIFYKKIISSQKIIDSIQRNNYHFSFILINAHGTDQGNEVTSIV